MAWCRPGDKPLSEPMMVSLLTHICVTGPQWVNLTWIWMDMMGVGLAASCLLKCQESTWPLPAVISKTTDWDHYRLIIPPTGRSISKQSITCYQSSSQLGQDIPTRLDLTAFKGARWNDKLNTSLEFGPTTGILQCIIIIWPLFESKLHVPSWEITSRAATGANNFIGTRNGKKLVGGLNTTMSPRQMLTHWGWDKMAAIPQKTFSNAFSWMKMCKFRLRFHRNLFPTVQLTIFQH